MAGNTWNDEKLVAGICGKTEERKEALAFIFKNLEWRKLTIQHVLNKGGNQQDGEDVFQEVLILFDRNIREKRFKGDSTLKTYFYATVKWYWLGELRKRKPQEEFAPQHELRQEDSVEARVISDEKKEYLQEALEKIGGRCKEILNLYGKRYSMEEIAERLSYANAKVAKKAAYRCRVKLGQFFEANPDWIQYVS
ncbi:MAG: sigma-70 family RNA polymerase sigma factor [Saprospiraceae bacterium]|nr:sigma-70 family RNA polymerase sigma factor [Saprospiraceae bacterium]